MNRSMDYDVICDAGVDLTEERFDVPTDAGSGMPSLDWSDDWELAVAVRRVRRWLDPPSPLPMDGAREDSWRLRLDLPYPRRAREHGQRPIESLAPRPSRRWSAFSWVATLFGITLAACGVTLIAHSLTWQRPDYWNCGALLIVGGQLGLVAGVAVQLWQGRRRAAAAAGHPRETAARGA